MPVQNALHHPLVSPYTTPIIKTMTPAIDRTQKEWNARVVPQWNHRVVPLWRRTVTPAWNIYVAPQIEKAVEVTSPYQQAVSEKLSPYAAHLQRAALRTRPILIKAAFKTYDGYQICKPFLGRVYLQLQRIPPVAMDYVFSPLASARRQFVDPHVALLVEKVKELSSGSSKSLRSDLEPAEPEHTPSTVQEAEGSHESVTIELAPVPEASNEEPSLASAASIVSASAYLSEPTVESVPGATYSPAAQEEDAAAALSSVLASSSAPSEVVFTETAIEVETVVVEEVVTQVIVEGSEVPSAAGQDVPIEVETVVVQEVVTETIVEVLEVPETPAVAPVVDGDILTEIATAGPAEIATESPKEVAAEQVAPISVPKPHRPSSVPGAASDLKGDIVTDDDLEDFVAQLGLEVEEPEQEAAAPVHTPEQVSESPEEKAAREAAKLTKIADKRKNIVRRHTEWEDKLASAIESQSVVLRRAIIALRKAAVEDLKTNGAVRDVVGTFDSEAQKALRGTRAYITKLKDSDKSVDEQTRLWERVLEKVEAKIEGRMKEIEEVVNKWYQETVLAKEEEEVCP